MATLQVPEQHYAGFEVLLGLNDDEAIKLVEALTDLQPTLKYTKVASKINEYIPRLTFDDAKNALGAILSVYTLLSYQAMTVDEVSAEITKAIAEEEKIPKPTEWKPEKFIEQLTHYLNIGGNLHVIAKAVGVMIAHDRVYGRARVISDIRPIFGSNALEKPQAAVIVHMLRLSYHENDEHKEFFVALDTQDIRSLQQTLNRATEKTSQLKEVIEAAGLFYIDVDEQE